MPSLSRLHIIGVNTTKTIMFWLYVPPPNHRNWYNQIIYESIIFCRYALPVPPPYHRSYYNKNYHVLALCPASKSQELLQPNNLRVLYVAVMPSLSRLHIIGLITIKLLYHVLPLCPSCPASISQELQSMNIVPRLKLQDF